MWNTVFFQPLYNALVWLVGNMPDGSVALAIIVLTVVVKLILAPLSFKALKSQVIQKELQPHMVHIRKEYPDKKEQSVKIMELYKKFKTNPFSGCLVILIQIPIIFALYYVFLRGLDFNTELLYTAVHYPDVVTTTFLGIDMNVKSLAFALAAGLAQFIQKEDTLVSQDTKPTFADQFGSNLQKQMLYTMPIIIVIVGMAVPAAVSLYWIVTNVFAFIQEFLAKKRLAQIRASYYSAE